jgi:ubiquinone/menaquinone biosynthesis C-methylase UbiE
MDTGGPTGITASDRERVRTDNIRLHQTLARQYDQIHPHMRNAFEQRMQRRDIEMMTDALGRRGTELRVVDVGCGTGNLMLRFLEAGYAVTGVDMSSEMLAVLQDKLAAVGLPASRYRLVQADAESFIRTSDSDRNRAWAIAAMSSVAHHLHDYLSPLAQLARGIESGGFLYLIHEPAHKAEMSSAALPLRRLWSVVPRGLDRIGRWAKRNPAQVGWAEQDTRFADYHYHLDGISVRAIDERLAPLGFKLFANTRYNAHETDVASWLDNMVAPWFRYEQFQRTYFRAIWQRRR